MATESEELVPKVIVIQQDHNNVSSNHAETKTSAGSELMPITTVHTTSYTHMYPRIISDKLLLTRPTLVSLDTIFQMINCVALITLNISVLLLYDRNRFERVNIIWAIFAFSCVSMVIHRYEYKLVMQICEIFQCILYSYFCHWNTKPLISFSVLLFVMVCCKLLPLVINRFCVCPVTYIVNQYVSRKRKNILTKTGECKWRCEGFVIVVTTVPLFYFNQTQSIFGQIWFGIIVVIILYYHQIMYVLILLYKDYYISELIDTVVAKSKNKLEYNTECDRDLFELELRECISNEHKLTRAFMSIQTLFIDTIAIPLVYEVIVFVSLFRYLLMFPETEMTQFEYVYSIILCVLIGITLCCWLVLLCVTKVLNIRS